MHRLYTRETPCFTLVMNRWAAIKWITLGAWVCLHLSAVRCQTRGVMAFVAMDVNTGEVRYERNGNVPLVPASIYKINLGYLAYRHLSPDDRFHTKVGITGKTDQFGLLHGDLYIIGEGDPSLGSKHFGKEENQVYRVIAERLTEHGIDCIKGKIIIDASAFGSFCLAPTWPLYDLGNYYACGAWGVNIADNASRLTFQLSEDRTKGPRLLSHTGDAGMLYVNELVSGSSGSGDMAYIYGGPFQRKRHIRGSLPKGSGQMTIRGSLAEPPRYFAEALADYLNHQGIQTDGIEVVYGAVRQRDVRIVHEFTSPELSELLKVMLRKSDNLISEAVFRRMTPGGDYLEAIEAIRILMEEHLNENLCFTAKDGCGLSPFNRICASEMVSNLRQMYIETPEYTLLLPAVEQTSLRAYTEIEDILVKSGYMEGVCSYAGFIGNDIAFCMIYNGKDYRDAGIKKKLAELLNEIVN